MRTVVLIPARFASSRYPGKPLVELLGKPMILWVAELSAKAVGRSNTYIATDSEAIANVVVDAGYQAIITAEEALTGTDRLAEAAEKIAAEIFINVQGDEPLVCPTDIIKIRDAKLKNMDSVVNGFCWLSKEEDVNNINIPKVITNQENKLIYMSRAPIPGFKDTQNAPSRYKKQVCIYGFTREELAAFKSFNQKSSLEQCEDIEILRFFELGKNILMVETKPGSLAVDCPEDVANVEAALTLASL
jgi:3-deoxy-manno-octulosonate cytidylyltransferase (CMP-KDO synthetase)